MKLHLTLTTSLLLLSCSVASADLVTSFDTEVNWTAGSGTLGSYQDDHVYTENGVRFTGGDALRQASSAQDGFPAALGTYAWRLRNEPVTWTATYASVSDSIIDGFSFDARRWDSSPSPSFDISYSLTGSGGSFTSVGTINNTSLGGSSDWENFSFSFASSTVTDDDFVVRLQSTTGERAMIDNFAISTVATVPEPSAFLFGSLICGVLGWKNARQQNR